MDMKTIKKEIPMQDAATSTWKKKYQLIDNSGKPVDKTITETFKRIAKALSATEKDASDKKSQYKVFLWALENGATPAGRILSNAGAEKYKPATSTINCTVSDTIGDSMHDILQKNMLAGLTLKAGCGIGYEFSTLRPSGAWVAGAGATTSGPLSFMDIYDKMCFTVSSAGGRRGAQMATFDISHPDVFEFIKAKREDGRLRQFNLSLLITSAFMEAVRSDQMWPLSFPTTQAEMDLEGLSLDNPHQIEFRDVVNTSENYIERDGLVACKIYKTVKAKTLMNVIMASTYDFAEPGFILIDKVNEMNNNWFCEKIRATNPCGEQPLPPNGSCLLGSVNLTKFVDNPFTPNASFDYKKFGKVVRIFSRMLDNVVEISGLPLPEQREELARKRRHGMGVIGLGSAMAMMEMTYGSEESVALSEKIAKSLAVESWEASLELALEKGPAPIMNEDFTVTAAMIAKRPEMKTDGLKVGDSIKGKVLWGKYSRYMQQLAEVDPQLAENLIRVGGRYTHATSMAPTGTIALSLGNNASNGIEPSFAHCYSRNIIREGKKSKENVNVYSYEMLAYRELINPDATKDNLPSYFTQADKVTPKGHVDVQAAIQKWVDSSISKTINVDTKIDFEEFSDVYTYGYDSGLKGCTTFRFNPEAFQGVLVQEKDLENTHYTFSLEDGSKVTCAGNEEIEYDGEVHTAANLYDALKEGYYGKL